jgi:hypothetical protein
MKSSTKGNGGPDKSRARYLAARALLEAGRFMEIITVIKSVSAALRVF